MVEGTKGIPNVASTVMETSIHSSLPLEETKWNYRYLKLTASLKLHLRHSLQDGIFSNFWSQNVAYN